VQSNNSQTGESNCHRQINKWAHHKQNATSSALHPATCGRALTAPSGWYFWPLNRSPFRSEPLGSIPKATCQAAVRPRERNRLGYTQSVSAYALRILVRVQWGPGAECAPAAQARVRRVRRAARRFEWRCTLGLVADRNKLPDSLRRESGPQVLVSAQISHSKLGRRNIN